jgi:hypothetical protein
MTSLTNMVKMVYTLLWSVNPSIKLAVAFGSLILGVNTYAKEMWDALFARIDALAVGVVQGLDLSPLATMNYFLPLDLICSYLVAYLALRLACVAIRVIKSFIPTVA